MTELGPVRDSVADVLRKECTLRRVHEHVDGLIALDDQIRSLATELGWFRLAASDASGGLGFGVEAIAVVAEELGRVLAPGAIPSSMLLAQVIDELGPPDLRERYLVGLLDGSLSVALEARLDRPASAPATPRIIVGGSDTDLLVVVVDEAPGGGQSLGLIDLRLHGDVLRPKPAWDRTRQLGIGSIDDGDVVVLGAAALARAIQLSAIIAAADALGLSEAVLMATRDYLCTREQFGRKIGTFQALKHRMANMHARNQVSRCLLEETVERSAAANDDGPLWAGLCKADLTDAAAFTTAEALQLHGGIGFTWEHDCHLFLKRARLDQALVGDNNLLRDRMADRLFARRECSQ